MQTSLVSWDSRRSWLGLLVNSPLLRESRRKGDSLSLDAEMCKHQAWPCRNNHMTPTAERCILQKRDWSHWISHPGSLSHLCYPVQPCLVVCSLGIHQLDVTPVLTVVSFIFFLSYRKCFLVSYRFPSSLLYPLFPEHPKNYASREHLSKEDSAHVNNSEMTHLDLLNWKSPTLAFQSGHRIRRVSASEGNVGFNNPNPTL